jgi:hypothetical protein
VTQSFAQTLHELNMDVLLFSRESTVPEKGKEPENSSITIHYVVRMYTLASERRALSPKWPATHPFKALEQTASVARPIVPTIKCK